MDVTFANLYFAAADMAGNPAAVPLAWGSNRSSAGMNAHINHDLPVAMVSTASTALASRMLVAV